MCQPTLDRLNRLRAVCPAAFRGRADLRVTPATATAKARASWCHLEGFGATEAMAETALVDIAKGEVWRTLGTWDDQARTARTDAEQRRAFADLMDAETRRVRAQLQSAA